MKTFQDFVDDCIKKLGVNELKTMLLDFGFKESEKKYEAEIVLCLPDNPFGVYMEVSINMRGYVSVDYDINYVAENRRYVLSIDSVEFIFNEIHNLIEELFNDFMTNRRVYENI